MNGPERIFTTALPGQNLRTSCESLETRVRGDRYLTSCIQANRAIATGFFVGRFVRRSNENVDRKFRPVARRAEETMTRTLITGLLALVGMTVGGGNSSTDTVWSAAKQ